MAPPRRLSERGIGRSFPAVYFNGITLLNGIERCEDREVVSIGNGYVPAEHEVSRLSGPGGVDVMAGGAPGRLPHWLTILDDDAYLRNSRVDRRGRNN